MNNMNSRPPILPNGNARPGALSAPQVPVPPSPNSTQVFIAARNNAAQLEPLVAKNIPKNSAPPPLISAADFFCKSDKETFVGKCIDNRYDIISHLASGGMSEIYLASQRGIGQQVILKKLHPHLYQDQNAVQRFIDEARTYATITHPNAVKMYDLLNVNGQICLVMEYVAGKTLTSYLDSGYVFSVRQIIDIAMQLADAIGTVHNAGIIHRDLKSQNIMLMETVGNRFSVKILDFGIAKIKNNTNLTQEGAIVGSPKYMSPEQGCGRKDIDKRTDIYSFGVLLYEMTCGHLPFDGESSLVILHQQIYADVPFIERPDNTNIPPELTNLILKCLKKNADERYSSFDEIVCELTDIQEGRSVGAISQFPQSNDYDEYQKTADNDILLLDDIAADPLSVSQTQPQPALKENADTQAPSNPKVPAKPIFPASAPTLVNQKPPINIKKTATLLKVGIIILLLVVAGMGYFIYSFMSSQKSKQVTSVSQTEPAPAAQVNDKSQELVPDESVQNNEQPDDDSQFDFENEPLDESDTTNAPNPDNSINKAAKRNTANPNTANAAAKNNNHHSANTNENQVNRDTATPPAAQPEPKEAVQNPVPAPAPAPAAQPEPAQPSQNTAAEQDSAKPDETKPQETADAIVANKKTDKPAVLDENTDEIDIDDDDDEDESANDAKTGGAKEAKIDTKEEAPQAPKNPSELTLDSVDLEFHFLGDTPDKSLAPHIHKVLFEAQNCKWQGNTGLQFTFVNNGTGSTAKFQRRFSGNSDSCMIKAFENYSKYPALEKDSTTVKIVIQKR